MQNQGQKRNKKVVYTVITAGYNFLLSYRYRKEDWDYICFTDDETLIKNGHNFWKILPIANLQLEDTKKSRYPKILAHEVLKDYDYSLYVDGNIELISDTVYEKIENFIKSGVKMAITDHYSRICIYEEAKICALAGKELPENIIEQVKIFQQQGFPRNYGLKENNIIYRKHNDKEIKKIMEQWWYWVKNYSKRDQLSLMYVLWKNHYPKIPNIMEKSVRLCPEDIVFWKHMKLKERSKTILITGGAGFIGSTLSEELLKEYKVIVIDNFDDNYDISVKEKNIAKCSKNTDYKYYKIDITDKEALDAVFEENVISKVVHLAAKVGVRESIRNPQGYEDTNVIGTKNLLEAMQKHQVKKLVFASSSSVYGESDAEAFSEEMVIKPISPYAKTKAECEKMCYEYSQTQGNSAICLRFFTVYGPRQRPDLAIHKFAKLIMEDKPIPVYGDGTTKRDYTYIDDIVRGIVSAINCESEYEIINLGGGNPISLDEMINTLEKTIEKKAIISRLPLQQGDVFKTAADITKAKKLLGYEPQINFQEGINKMIEWLK